MTSGSASRRPFGDLNVLRRENQLLPGDWRQLGQIDLKRISAALKKQSGKGASLATLEACMMVRAILTTGRPLELLAKLNFEAIGRGDRVASLPSGLYFWDRRWNWWLTAGAPVLKESEQGPDMDPTSPNIWLPISSNFAVALKRCLILRKVYQNAQSQPLFITSTTSLRSRALAILEMRAVHGSKARRSASTIESAERWLPRALAQEAGGDPGSAALICDRSPSLAKPMMHYGALSMPKAIQRHAVATQSFDGHFHNKYPPEIAALSIGDPRTPTDNAVRSLIEQLSIGLRRAKDVSSIHAAMTFQICALFAFSLGLRGTGGLPNHQSIDDLTGFCVVHDKYRDDPHQARFVWVPQVAREQLARYHEHLNRVLDWLSPEARRAVSSCRDDDDQSLPLFWLVSRDKIRPTTLNKVLSKAKSLGWPGRANAGRHWLRAQLAGQCSAETLGAFFGHWQAGVEPWSEHSSLDPILYRADIQRVLEPTLHKIGWRDLSAPI
jgi:hypothetical protein